jgi:hypothetical protein
VLLAAASSFGRGQFVTVNSSGYAALNDGTVPGLKSAGVAFPEVLLSGPTANGGATGVFWWGFGCGAPASTAGGDSFTAADLGVPCWIADENTAGKLAYNSDDEDRSLAGLVFGLAPDGTPLLWSGPVAQLVARATVVADSFAHAWYSFADSAANAATSERAIPTAPVHGVITAVEFTGAAVAADGTDYGVITLKRYRASDDYATGVTVATYDTRAAPTGQGAITALTPAAFALSATAANRIRRVDDIFTIASSKAGAGKTLLGNVRVVGSVI